MPLLTSLQESMQEQKTITDLYLSPSSSVLPCDSVAAATFQNDILYGVTAGLELLSKMLGRHKKRRKLWPQRQCSGPLGSITKP